MRAREQVLAETEKRDDLARQFLRTFRLNEYVNWEPMVLVTPYGFGKTTAVRAIGSGRLVDIDEIIRERIAMPMPSSDMEDGMEEEMEIGRRHIGFGLAVKAAHEMRAVVLTAFIPPRFAHDLYPLIRVVAVAGTARTIKRVAERRSSEAGTHAFRALHGKEDAAKVAEGMTRKYNHVLRAWFDDPVGGAASGPDILIDDEKEVDWIIEEHGKIIESARKLRAPAETQYGLAWQGAQPDGRQRERQVKPGEEDRDKDLAQQGAKSDDRDRESTALTSDRESGAERSSARDKVLATGRRDK